MSALSLPAAPRSRRLLAAAGIVATLLTPAAAHASGTSVVRDCTDDGRLSKTYTQKEYADALKNIPTDVDEYTDCRDVIRRAQLAGAGGSSGGSGSSGGQGGSGGASTTTGGTGGTGGGTTAGTADEALQGASDDERAAVDALRAGGADTPVQVGSRTLTPQDLAKTDLGTLSTVPTPLLIVLALLVLASVTGGGSAILNRVRAARSTPGA